MLIALVHSSGESSGITGLVVFIKIYFYSIIEPCVGYDIAKTWANSPHAGNLPLSAFVQPSTLSHPGV